jgi:hypothetical protein
MTITDDDLRAFDGWSDGFETHAIRGMTVSRVKELVAEVRKLQHSNENAQLLLESNELLRKGEEILRKEAQEEVRRLREETRLVLCDGNALIKADGPTKVRGVTPEEIEELKRLIALGKAVEAMPMYHYLDHNANGWVIINRLKKTRRKGHTPLEAFLGKKRVELLGINES